MASPQETGERIVAVQNGLPAFGHPPCTSGHLLDPTRQLLTKVVDGVSERPTFTTLSNASIVHLSHV